MRSRALFFALCLPFALVPALAPACEPNLPVTPPALVYVPFASEPVTREMPLRLQNTGAAPCSLGVAVFSETAALRSGPAELRFAVRAADGVDMLNPGLPPQHGAALRMALAQIAPGGEAVLPWRFILPAGQVPAPGVYSSLLRVALYDTATGALRQEPLAVPVSAAVDAVLRLSLAGGGQGATLDFGRMTDGAVRTVLLRARANVGFALTLSSENRGAMTLRGSAGDGAHTRAGYRVSVNGGPPLGLEAPQVAPVSPEATSLGGMTAPLEIVLGETGHLRAGEYRDVVTITVETAF